MLAAFSQANCRHVIRRRIAKQRVAVFFKGEEMGATDRQAVSRRGQAPCAVGDAGDDRIEVTDHLMVRNPHNMPAQLVERAIPRAIMTRAPHMGRPVNLDDEPHLGAREVDDVLPDDELTTIRKPGLGPRKSAPEPLLRARGRTPHDARTLFEELSASGRDKSTTEHEDLQEVGADARRAKSKSAASMPRRRRLVASPSCAAGKVRGRSSARGRADRRPQGAALSSSSRPRHRGCPSWSVEAPSPFRAQAAGRARIWGRQRAKPAGRGHLHTAQYDAVGNPVQMADPDASRLVFSFLLFAETAILAAIVVAAIRVRRAQDDR